MFPVPAFTDEDLLARVLYRDALMLVIDKPYGLPVHPGSGGGDTLDRHFDALRFGLPQAPQLAHRLDRETTGCLVLGRHRQALKRLGDQFAQGRVGKTYWAIVEGAPAAPEGVIDLALGRESAAKHRWRMQPDPSGQQAITRYKILAVNDHLSWLELRPETGRTHQLRVHCAAIGCPILGDRAYGNAQADLPLHLHARAVSVPLYPKRAPVSVEAPPPPHLAALLAGMFGTPETV